MSKVRFRPEFSFLFSNGLSTGILSFGEIASALPRKIRKDRILTEAVLDWLLNYLEQLDIKVVPDEVKEQILKLKREMDWEVEVLFPSTSEQKKAEKILGKKMFSLFKALSIYRQKGDGQEEIQLRNKIVEKNLKLVRGVSRKFSALIDDLAIDEEDLFQEGTFGLIKAIKHFDYLRGFQFSTFADLLVTRYLKQYLTRSRSAQISLRKSLKLIFAEATFSISTAEDEFEKIEKTELLRKLLLKVERKFSARERYCFTEYFFKGQTLQEIGDILELTRERVRQFIEDALLKLETSSNLTLLSELVTNGIIIERISKDQVGRKQKDEIRQFLVENSHYFDFLPLKQKDCFKAYFGVEDNQPKSFRQIAQNSSLPRRKVSLLVQKGIMKLPLFAQRRIASILGE